MKKLKLLSILLCLILGFGILGCSSAVTEPMFDETLPWSEKGGSGCTETMTYDFARYLTGVTANPAFLEEGEDAGRGYKLTKSGTLVYTIKEGKSVAFEGGEIVEVDNSAHTLITMTMDVEYKDNLSLLPNMTVINLYQGERDHMESWTVLDRYSLTSLFTHKVTDIGGQYKNEAGEPIDSLNYTLTVNYAGSPVGSRGATLTDKTGTKSISIKDAGFYDSESIYFQIRAMRTIKTGGARGFNLALPYNDLIEGKSKLSARTASQSTIAATSMVDVSQKVQNFFAIPEAESEEEQENESEDTAITLECYKTVLKLSADKSGHGINLYFSVNPTIANYGEGIFFSAAKVPVAIAYPNHDETARADYAQEFILSNYSNTNY